MCGACGGAQAQPSPEWLSPAETGVAPRPFTAEQLRAGMPIGTELRYRIEEPPGPAVIMVMRVTASDELTGTIETQMLAEDGTQVKNLGAAATEWEALVKHATFPAAATTVSAKTIETPAGTYPGVEYVVREADTTRTFQFARSLPGPPVVLVETTGGKVTSRMTLLSRK